MPTERHFYFCGAEQFSGVPKPGKRLWIRKRTAPIHFRLLKLIHSCRPWFDPSGVDMVPIRLKLYMLMTTVPEAESLRDINFDEPAQASLSEEASPSEGVWVSEEQCVSETRFMAPVSDVRLLSKKHVYAKIMAGYLSSMSVPEYEQAAMIETIFKVIFRAVPGLPINVTIVHVAVLLDKVVPAVKPSLEALEKVRLDSLEDAIIRQTPCAICREALDCFDAAAEGIDNDELMITRLPCLHLYHGDCIVRWLEMCQVPLCPLCRYSMPIVEVTKSSSKPSGRLRWPMLLMISAGGMITATLLCRLLKRT